MKWGSANDRTRLGRSGWKLVALAGALLFAFILHAIGAGPAFNAVLQSWYYKVRGDHDADAHVIFIALDERTLDVWGAPPWNWQHLDPLMRTLLDAEPAAVAFLEPGPWIDERARPQWLEAEVASGRLILPTDPDSYQPRLGYGSLGQATSIELGSGQSLRGKTVFARLLETLGQTREGSLPVHYRGASDSLASLPAHRVALGEIPANVFRDRIVIIGFRGSELTSSVPTPVGMMSASEVHVHALLSLLEGELWLDFPLQQRMVLWALFAFLSLFAFAGGVVRRALWVPLLMTVAAIALDGFLFSAGIARLQIAGALFAGAFAGVAVWLSERKELDARLIDLQRWSADAAFVGGLGTGHRAFDWDALLGHARAMTGADSSLVLELPNESWRLEVRAATGTGSEEINEMRRDVRREPYKAPYSTHHLSWSERQFMRDQQTRSLLVPLSGFNRLLGIWVLNYPDGRTLSEKERRAIALLSEQMSLSVERDRLARLAQDAFESGSVAFGAGRLLETMNQVRRLTNGAVTRNRELNGVMDGLPFGVLIADLWGNVSFKNRFMLRWLEHHQIESMDRSFLELLDAITELESKDIEAMAEDVIMKESVARLALNVPSSTTKSAYLVAVRGVHASGQQGRESLSLVLILSEFELDERMVTDWTWRLRKRERSSHTG